MVFRQCIPVDVRGLLSYSCFLDPRSLVKNQQPAIAFYNADRDTTLFDRHIFLFPRYDSVSPTHIAQGKSHFIPSLQLEETKLYFLTIPYL